MGTNYFVRPHCSLDAIHLGKSSGGWSFTFRAYPEDSYRPPGVPHAVIDFASWCKLLDLGPIADEYGSAVAKADLLELIENKRGGRSSMYGSDFLDADGNRFVAVEFC